MQLASAQGAPVLLHASLAPAQAMSPTEFLAALHSWQGVLPCAIEGAGALDCLGEEPEEGELAYARELVASAAKQAAPPPLERPAARGSPGVL